MKFTPDESEQYMFDLPIMLDGINQQVEGLKRTVTGSGLKPKFLIDPSECHFG